MYTCLHDKVGRRKFLQIVDNLPTDCRIWDSHSGGYDELCPLAYNTVQPAEGQLTFRRRISSPSSASAMPRKIPEWKHAYSILKMKATCSSETSVDSQRKTGHYIPEESPIHWIIRHHILNERSLNIHRCENFTAHIYSCISNKVSHHNGIYVSCWY
jgi:hypothetical protein